MKGWHLVLAIDATTAFTGTGAMLHGGRWNHIGIPVVYASSSLALATLEVVVNSLLLSASAAYKAIPFEFPDSVKIVTLKSKKLPSDWKKISINSLCSTQDMGTKWIEDGRSVIMKVPSVIVPSEHNFLINPNHADFKKIKIGTPILFYPKQRLYNKGTWEVLI